MYVDTALCAGCGLCIPYCPMRAIGHNGVTGQAQIDEDGCVECEVCRTAGICPGGALTMQALEWPRTLRSRFSNPLITHPDTGVPGRGTEEMKTNEVTGRLRRGEAGVAAELGRPGTGARLRDVERVAMAVAQLGVHFEPANPVTSLMEDTATGKLREDVLGEKVLSAIVEFTVPYGKLPAVLARLREVAETIDTVFSLDLTCRLEEDGSNPAARLAMEAGFVPSANGKTNVGLGRSLAGEGGHDAHTPS